MSVLNQLSWLTGGFLLGMLCLYSLQPSYNQQPSYQSHDSSLQHLIRRDATSGIMRFGNPGPTNDYFERAAYTLSYDRRNRIPNWVGEHLTAQNIGRGSDVSVASLNYQEDGSIPLAFRATLADYSRSGYDRGQVAPSIDAGGTQQAVDETFLLSNIAPQVGKGFSRDYWGKLETFCRSLTSKFPDIYVYTGPLFLPETTVTGKREVRYEVIGKSGVAVPTHFYKIIVIPENNLLAVGAFLIPNQAIVSNKPVTDFLVPLETIESATGLTFLQSEDRSKFSKLCDVVACQLQ